MPIKWRLTLLSAIFLLIILGLFHGFVYQLFANMITETEQRVLQQKIATLAGIYKHEQTNSRRLKDQLSGWVSPFIDNGQAIRVTIDGKVEWQVNQGIPSEFFLKGKDARHNITKVHKNEGKQVSILARPLQGVKNGRVELYTDFTSLNRYLDTMLLALTIGSSILLVIVAVGGHVMARVAFHPVKKITRTVRELDPARLNSRLDVPATGDEIEELTRTFNGLLDRIYRLLEQQRRFTADASHELKTPVSIIRGYVNLLNRWGKENPDILEEALNAINQETDRMEATTDKLLSLARRESNLLLGTEQIELVEVLQQRVNRWIPVFSPREVTLTGDLDPIYFPIQRLDWEEVIDILLDNAHKYSKEGSVNVLWNVEEGIACLTVRDYGVGIPKRDLSRVLDRFYRSGQVRGKQQVGSGLGLSIAKRILQLHRGSIQIDSRLGEWTEVRILLPLP
ncbi:two-component system, OmpR family, sensor histidine kinase ArlS [Marininema mesophilum]|uniref:histidine kinase n=1 Tax=Marininema mesophilum TaxID=1048340 RepID=A0A1H2WNJ9_9BACL|nr:HAMP domain-containing sensor histidine kinase [Marininema mesophilum]SDW82161.1 two-component system, OmpR family, sensor histidine kinase ArlS [Marininema mesophilum]